MIHFFTILQFFFNLIQFFNVNVLDETFILVLINLYKMNFVILKNVLVVIEF